MPGLSLSFLNSNTLSGWLGGAENRAMAGMGAGLTTAAEELADLTRTNASGRPGPNVITGTLRDSIKAVPAERSGSGMASRVEVLGEDYFGYVERGTSKMPPYSYLGPAVTEYRRGPFQRTLVDALRLVMERAR